MKAILHLLILLFLPVVPEVKGQDPPVDQKLVTEKQLVYKSVGGIDLHVDLFIPENSSSQARRPAMAFFHGGGWAFGNPSTFHEICRWYARKGYVCAAFQYRLSIDEDGTYPHPDITPVECSKDARSALRWLKKNATDFQVDPERIIASGHSVGGQLSLACVLCDGVDEKSDDLGISPRPAALVIYSGTVNTLEVWCDMLMGDRREEIWTISPFHRLKTGMPPTLGFHGKEDCTVPLYTVTLFLEKARGLGNHIEYVFVDGKKHHLDEGNSTYSGYVSEDILEQSKVFLEKHGLEPDR